MSAEENSPQQPASPAPSRRRSSFTTNRLSEMFNSARNPGSPSSSPPNQSSPFPNQAPFGSSAPANASATGRRISISTLGLSGAGNGAQVSAGPGSASGPGNMWGFRRGSFSTGPPSNASSDESAIDDSTDATVNGSAVPAGSPFGRRMSFGARAMGQMRGENQGFNWADNLRTRQSRSGSAAGAGLMSPNRGSFANESMSQPPTQPPAPKEPAAPAPRRESQMKKPDHFQERILKGDFYMD